MISRMVSSSIPKGIQEFAQIHQRHHYKKDIIIKYTSKKNDLKLKMTPRSMTREWMVLSGKKAIIGERDLQWC